MAHERLKDSTLPHSLSEVVADLADLFQKELRLAKAEIFLQDIDEDQRRYLDFRGGRARLYGCV